MNTRNITFSKKIVYTKRFLIAALSFVLSFSLLFTPTATYGTEPPTITLDMYEQIEMDMTQEQVEDIVGGPGAMEGDNVIYLGAKDDSNAVEKVTIEYDMIGVCGKYISYNFRGDQKK